MEIRDNDALRNLIWNVVTEMFVIDPTQTANASLIFQPQTYTVAGVPAAATYPRGLIYVSNESGGKTLAFSDGTNWRRVQDLAIIS